MNFILNHHEQSLHQNGLFLHSNATLSQELLQHQQQHHLIPQRQKRKASSALATKNLIRDRLIQRINAKNGTAKVSRSHNQHQHQHHNSFEHASKVMSQALFYPTNAANQASSLKRSGSFDAFQTWINYDEDSVGSLSAGLIEDNVVDSKLGTLSDNFAVQGSSASRGWWGSYGNLAIGSLEALGEVSGGGGGSVAVGSGGYYEMLQNPVFFEEFMTAAMSNSGSSSTLYYKNAGNTELFQ